MDSDLIVNPRHSGRVLGQRPPAGAAAVVAGGRAQRCLQKPRGGSRRVRGALRSFHLRLFQALT